MITIHTKLFSDQAFSIIKGALNVREDALSAQSSLAEQQVVFLSVVKESTGEVVINVSDNSTCELAVVENDTGTPHLKYHTVCNQWLMLSSRTDFQLHARRIIAGWLKYSICDECKEREVNPKTVWFRTNRFFIPTYLSTDSQISVQDVYIVFDALVDKLNPKNYPTDALARIIGKTMSIDECKRIEARQLGIQMVTRRFHEQLKELEDAANKQKLEIEAKLAADTLKLKADYDVLVKLFDSKQTE